MPNPVVRTPEQQATLDRILADNPRLRRQQFHHEALWTVCINLPSDYQPWGQEEDGPQCSHGCMWWHALKGQSGLDWGVCFSPTSPRAGMLTFEHQAGKHCFMAGRQP